MAVPGRTKLKKNDQHNKSKLFLPRFCHATAILFWCRNVFLSLFLKNYERLRPSPIFNKNSNANEYGCSLLQNEVKKYFFVKRKYLCFLQNVHIFFAEKISFYTKQKFMQKKTITEKNFFRKKLFIQKIYVLK